MKTRHLLFSFVLILAIFLAACSPQAASTDNMMDDKDMGSETTSENMEEKDGAAMADDEDKMSDHDGDDMMAEKDDDAMMDDKDGEMEDHNDDEMMEDKDDDAMSDNKDEMADDAMMVSPEWFTVSLTDVNSGETFAVADFKGKVVLVETLAMWCSNCLKQQGQVQMLHDLVGENDGFISLGIDIDPNENADALKSYTNNNGFDWIYTVAPTEVW